MKQNTFWRYFLSLLIAATLLGCSREPVTPSGQCGGIPASSHPKAAVYQAVVDKYVRRGLPGIAVSITDNRGEWTSAGGKADIARNIAMEPCHLGKVASITKMVLATTAMLLVEEGKLNLDEPITKWLPRRVTDKLANANQITLFYLLTHQTGLKDYDGNQRFYLDVINNPYKKWTADDILRYVNNEPALFRPGSQASYSNTNTVVAAMVIEAATGKSHATLMREKVFTPLGMNNTYYQGHDPLPEKRVAQGYFDLFEDDVLVNVSDYSFGYGTGAGGLVSNVYDMQTFIRALFVQQRLLSQQSLDRMRQWYKETDSNDELGIGLIRNAVRLGPDLFAYGHSGGDLGFTSFLQWIPERNVSLAMFSNAGVGRGGSLTSLYYEFYYELYDKILE